MLLTFQPYDPKRSCWVPLEKEGGFAEGVIDSTEGKLIYGISLNIITEKGLLVLEIPRYTITPTQNF